MCIIVTKNKGVDLPKKAILRNCFENNPDGAGIMYTKNNKVIINKGYMSFESLWDRIKALKKEIDVKNTPIVFHFRIGTSGGYNPGNTHPFPLTTQNNKLLQLKTTADVGIAHNGIISTYEDRKNANLSDTQLFIKKFLHPIYKLDNTFYHNKDILEIIKTVTTSKFAILSKNSELILIGDFIEKNGIYYSNTSYQERTLKFTNTPTYYNYKNFDYTPTIEELMPLLDDDVAIGDNNKYYINYDYRKQGYLAIDDYCRLYLVNTEAETEKTELLNEYVELYDIKDLEYYTKKGATL